MVSLRNCILPRKAFPFNQMIKYFIDRKTMWYHRHTIYQCLWWYIFNIFKVHNKYTQWVCQSECRHSTNKHKDKKKGQIYLHVMFLSFHKVLFVDTLIMKVTVGNIFCCLKTINFASPGSVSSAHDKDKKMILPLKWS